MIVHTYQFDRPGGTATMAVSLEADGVVALFFEALILRNGQEHQFEAEVSCTSKLEGRDLDEVEASIRGNKCLAERLCWRTIDELFDKEVVK